MCGIVGYIGNRVAIPILVDGLKKLEYRGYDSAGVAVLDHNEIVVSKSVGKLVALEEELGVNYSQSFMGIGHTRWATHGRPSQVNAHPHCDCGQDFVVVHNGIIENYLELKDKLIEKGHQFVSETDTEVLAHLVEDYYAGDIEEAVRKVLKTIHGSYAMVVLSRKDPDKLVAARKDSPMVVGLGDGEYFIASDITAILNYTRKVYILD
ncbi:class II glutamine amidotransferase, partial [Desulfosporosinus sp. I2]|uniref:class II glutamine amidotransferase n=1 Tax=Desulfosporosinus sp. I2 TaxID=1617025 RepID=UPI0005ED8CC8